MIQKSFRYFFNFLFETAVIVESFCYLNMRNVIVRNGVTNLRVSKMIYRMSILSNRYIAFSKPVRAILGQFHRDY